MSEHLAAIEAALGAQECSEGTASGLYAVLARADASVHEALAAGHFDAPSACFVLPVGGGTYRLSELAKSDAPLAADHLDALDAALGAYARTLDAAALLDTIHCLDAAKFGVAASPFVERAHELLRAMAAGAGIEALGLPAEYESAEWRDGGADDDLVAAQARFAFSDARRAR